MTYKTKDALKKACLCGDLKGIQKAFRKFPFSFNKEIINDELENWETPLGYVVSHNTDKQKAEIIKYLIDHGADVNKAYGRHGSPLCTAAYIGDYESAKLLIDGKADVNASCEDGTPLSCAAGSGCYEVVRLLVDNGADVNRITEKHETALTTAMAFPDIEESTRIAKYLIEHAADIHGEELAFTPLMTAVRRYNFEMVKQLVMAGAKLNKQSNGFYDGYCGYTALMLAVDAGVADPIDLILERGGRVDLRTNDGRTAIDIALSKRFTAEPIRMVKTYLKTGKVDLKNILLLPATNIIVFTKEQEANYGYRYILDKKIYDSEEKGTSITYYFKRENDKAEYDYLIIHTGFTDYMVQRASDVNSMKKAFVECFPQKNPDTDWNCIVGKFTLSNYALEGYEVTDTEQFDRILNAVKGKHYLVDKILPD